MYAYNAMNLPVLPEIGRIRRKLGLSQTQLARKSGVSQSLIARIESGKIDPGYSKVVALFSALKNVDKDETSVSEIMAHKVYGVSTSETMERAASKMKLYGISKMPVFEKGKIIGSISESTILSQIASGADARDLSKRKVTSFVEDPLPTVNPSTPLTAVSTLLDSHPAVIVMEKGKVRGIASKSDLLKMVHK